MYTETAEISEKCKQEEKCVQKLFIIMLMYCCVIN